MVGVDACSELFFSPPPLFPLTAAIPAWLSDHADYSFLGQGWPSDNVLETIKQHVSVNALVMYQVA